MLVRAPIRIGPLSPRMTAPNQMLDSSPTSTSPIKTAVGATKAVGWILGRLPPYSTIIQRSFGGGAVEPIGYAPSPDSAPRRQGHSSSPGRRSELYRR